MTRRTTTARVSRVAALLAACAVAASLSSCGRSDPIQEEIDRVSVGLGAISTSGSTALPSVENRKAMYQWVIARLTGTGGGAMRIEGVATTDSAPSSPSAVNSSNPGQASAANQLVARGHAGLGEIAAQEAARLEAGAALQIAPIRAALDQWLAQNAAADALKAYDPARDIAAIEQQIGEKQKLADDARATKDRQTALIADLEKQAQELTDRSKTMRAQEAEIRGRATNVSETQRLDLITEATRTRREADEVEKQAAHLLARVAMEKPNAEMQQRGIDELTTQIQLLRTDKESLRQRATQRAEASERMRGEAQAAAGRLAQMLTAFTGAREAIAAPTEAATKAYESAVSAAKKMGTAGGDAKRQSAITSGNYQHALADVLSTRARGEQAYADLLSALAAAKPALPNAAELSSKASAAAQSAKESTERARAAFEAAQAAYKSAGGTGDTQDRLQALEASMNALLGSQPAPEEGAAPAADAPEGDMADPAAPTDETAAGADLSAVEGEVRAAMAQITAATSSGDVGAMQGMLHVEEAAARPVIDAIVQAGSGISALNKACTETYGKGLKQVIDESSVQSIKSNPMIAGILQQADQMSVAPDVDFASAVVTPVSATEAMVTAPESEESDVAQSLKFVKVDGVWKVDIGQVLAALGGPAQLQAMGPMLEPFKAVGGAFGTVARKLKEGAYADADAMLIDLNKEATAAMVKQQGGGGGSGGTGGG